MRSKSKICHNWRRNRHDTQCLKDVLVVGNVRLPSLAWRDGHTTLTAEPVATISNFYFEAPFLWYPWVEGEDAFRDVM
jgi:hypothetical protein